MATLVARRDFSVVAVSDVDLPTGVADDLDRLGAQRLAARCDTARARNRLGAALDRVILGADLPVVIVAQGVGCLATRWWAQLSPRHYVSRIAGAVFVDPAPPGDHPLFMAPNRRLPFPSTMVERRLPNRAMLADDWGSDPYSAPGTGRASRFSLAALLIDLTRRVVDHDTRMATRMQGGT